MNTREAELQAKAGSNLNPEFNVLVIEIEDHVISYLHHLMQRIFRQSTASLFEFIAVSYAELILLKRLPT